MSNFEQSTAAHTHTGFNKRAEGALEPSGADLLSGDAGYGQQAVGQQAAYGQTGMQQRGGMNEVCDPPTIYNAAGAHEALNYVHDNQRERTYEPLDVNKTVVQHEIERVKPVLHQEEHKTRLHEVVHHKVDAPRDLGITEVVHHGHTDPCGNALGGVGHNTTGAGLLGGHNTSGMNTVNSDTSSLQGQSGTPGYTGAGATGTGTYGQQEETHGIKGMINKVVPGQGPFKH